MKIVRGAVIGIGVVAAVASAVPGFAGGNKYAATALTRDCGDGDAVNWLGALTLWPPNHKLQSVSVAADGSDSTETVTIEVDPVVTDAAGGDGGPQHDPDFTYESGPAATGTDTATVDFALRSERSGRGDGRTYTINWLATFDDGTKTCSSSDDGQSPFVVTVPHDMRDKRS